MKRRFSLILAVILVVALAVPALAAPGDAPKVVDHAQLLTGDERKALEKKAQSLAQRYGFDFVIVTTDHTGAASPMQYADDFYDYNHYGYGEEADGILLLVSMADRAWWISTCGYGITAFTEYGQEYMMDRVLPLLSGGDYAGAFAEFLRQAEDLLKQANAGKPLDVPERFEGFPAVSLVVCALLGFGLAFFPMGALKKQVRNVESRQDAMDYASGGLELSRRTDRFLYASVSKRAKPKESSSGSRSGGSSTHTSSSGRTHGGSGGHF